MSKDFVPKNLLVSFFVLILDCIYVYYEWLINIQNKWS